jgi:hypothetical protein
MYITLIRITLLYPAKNNHKDIRDSVSAGEGYDEPVCLLRITFVQTFLSDMLTGSER